MLTSIVSEEPLLILTLNYVMDNRLRRGVSVDEASREHQRVLQVGALHVLRLDRRHVARAQHPRVVREADDLQRILGELRRDESL